MKHKKVLLIALICLIGIGISSIFLFSGHRPFKDLEATDITSANVRLSPPDTTVQIVETERGPHYTWELYIVELLHSRREFVDPLSRAFRNALVQLDFLPAWQMIYPTIQEDAEIE